MTKSEDKNYLRDSKSVGTAFPDWAFHSPEAPEVEKTESDHLLSQTRTEERFEESAPGSPAALWLVGEQKIKNKKSSNLANVCEAAVLREGGEYKTRTGESEAVSS